MTQLHTCRQQRHCSTWCTTWCSTRTHTSTRQPGACAAGLGHVSTQMHGCDPAFQALPPHCCCCRRVLLQQQLPPELLLALLASSQDEVVGGALHAAHGLTSFAPAVVPVDAAPRLVQLLCHQSHGKEEQEQSGSCSTAACGRVVLNN